MGGRIRPPGAEARKERWLGEVNVRQGNTFRMKIVFAVVAAAAALTSFLVYYYHSF